MDLKKDQKKDPKKDQKKEQKKQRRFPLYDVALLLLLALVIAAGVYWATTREEQPTEELLCTVRFSGVDNAYSGTFTEGATLYTSSGEVLGEIRTVTTSRALEAFFDAGTAQPGENGLYAYTYTRSGERSDILLTVRVTAEVRDGGYFVGNHRVAAGTMLDAMVTGYRGQGLVLTLAQTQEGEQS